jgi:uncharacterized protein (UPF0333 family)
MRKYLKYLLVALALIVITGFYFYNKPVKSTSSKIADITIKAEELFNQFESNENQANQMYLDKVVSVKGIIKTIAINDSMQAITLNANAEMAGVICEMEQNEKLPDGIKPGDAINIKGICTGMLMDVVLVRCVIE